MKDGKKAAIGIGLVTGVGALIYLASRAEAAPPVPPEGIYCPYCTAGPFATIDDANEHIVAEHPGMPLLIHIIWD